MCNKKLLVCAFLLPLLQVNCSLRGPKCILDYSVGTCVVLGECQHLATEILRAGKPMPLYIKNKLHNLNCGSDGKQIKVCCVPPHHTDSINRRFSETQSSNINSNKTGSKVIPNTKIPDIQNHPNLRLLPTNCSFSGTDRIFGGTSTRLFEMPWMAILSYQSVRGTESNCGGTLINEWYVLTAAHCLAFLPYGVDLKHVILGDYDIYQDPDCQEDDDGKLICAPGIKTIAIAEAIPHSGYNKNSLTDDIALIRLSEPANFSLANIKPVCLPLTPTLQKENLVGKNSVVAGWGITEDGVKSSTLLKVYLPIITKEDCQAAYNGKAVIHDQQLCAGGFKNKDSCGGDSGGPLIFPGKLGPGGAKFIQRGIVSFGTQQCGLAGFPGVYTNVAYYMDWILDHMHS